MKLEDDVVESKLTTYWGGGYMVFEPLICTDVVVAILEKAMELETYANILKISDSSALDETRSQAPLEKDFGTTTEATSAFVKHFHMKWRVKKLVVIKSLSDGPEQDPYRSFSTREILLGREKGLTQAELIVELSAKTQLVIYEGCFAEADIMKRKEIELGSGDAVIFRGDLVHAEASFPVINVHLYCKLQAKVIKAFGIIERMPTEICKCPYSSYIGETMLNANNHLRYCRLNASHNRFVSKRKENENRPIDCPFCDITFPRCAANYQHKHRKRKFQSTETPSS